MIAQGILIDTVFIQNQKVLLYQVTVVYDMKRVKFSMFPLAVLKYTILFMSDGPCKYGLLGILSSAAVKGV